MNLMIINKNINRTLLLIASQAEIDPSSLRAAKA
jgi:hypothetical protein